MSRVVAQVEGTPRVSLEDCRGATAASIGSSTDDEAEFHDVADDLQQ